MCVESELSGGVVAVSVNSGVGDPKFENRHLFFNFYFFLKFLRVCVSV